MSNMKNNKYNDMFSYTSNGAAMNFSVHGPFDLSRHRGSVDVRRHAKREFWRQVENDEASLPDGCGCYVYCVRAGKGQRPWYVGLAEMQSFKAECFRPHKILAYNQAIALRKGTPTLYLLACRTPQRRLVKPSANGHRSAALLEILLIGAALEKNPDLVNIVNTALLRDMVVPTIIHTPRRPPTVPEREFGAAMR